MRARALASLLIAWATACGDDGSGDTAAETSAAGSTGGPAGTGDATTGSGGVDESGSGSEDTTDGIIEIDCTEACADTASEAGIAVCYSCRCKAAMDGYMPPVELLQCSEATDLGVFTADLSGAEPTLVELTTTEDTCVNPALLTETCGTGSRLGQIREGNISIKWICRDPVGPPMDVYSDVGVIMYNRRNGASCWFDDIDVVTSDDNLPDLDLMEAGEDNLAGYLERFYFTDGDSCSTSCHDADPFIYTPYLRTTAWDTVHALGPYTRISLSGGLDPVNSSHLVSPEIEPCAECHRVGSAAGCEWLGPDSVGDFKTAAHEQSVHDATAPGSPNWKLAYWMPYGPQKDTLADWNATYGAAKAHYAECCQSPGVSQGACMWEPIPTQ